MKNSFSNEQSSQISGKEGLCTCDNCGTTFILIVICFAS